MAKIQGTQDSNDGKLVEEKSNNSHLKGEFNFLLSVQIFIHLCSSYLCFILMFDIIFFGVLSSLTGGIILSFEPLSVAFEDMDYYVDIPAVLLSSHSALQ